MNYGGAYTNLLSVDGSSYVDSTDYYAPVDFDSDLHDFIVYNPGDYVAGSNIELRIRVTTDTGWSDQDGLFPTGGRGACAVDDINVSVNAAQASFANWEDISAKTDNPEGDVSGHDNGADTGTTGWQPTPTTFAGDFAKLYGQVYYAACGCRHTH